MKPHKIYTRYDPPPQIGVHNIEPTMTQQHFREECDINQILAKFQKTGILDTIGPGVYADIGDAADYQRSLDIIREANEVFSDLPATLRKEFDNDPAQYLDFVSNPDNLEKGVKLGIFKPEALLKQKEVLGEPINLENTPPAG